MLHRWRKATKPWRYPFASVLVVAAGVLRWLAGDLLAGLTFITFFPVVFASALLGGWRVGAFAVVLSAALAWWAIMPPEFSFAFKQGALVALLTFLSASGLLVWMAWLLEQEERRHRAAAQRSDLLFRELKHRVSNILQLCSSLLRLRSHDLEPRHRHVVTDAAAQLVAMQRIHDHIAGSGATVDLEPPLKDLCETVLKLSPSLRYELSCIDVTLPRDHLIPVALIVHELLNNTVEHGHNGSGAVVRVHAVRETKGGWRLSVTDEGPGLPDGFSMDGNPRQGLKIVRALAAQAQASFSVRNRPDGHGVLAELSSDGRPTAP